MRRTKVKATAAYDHMLPESSDVLLLVFNRPAVDRGRKHPEQQYIQMDTSNILFICGGTFVGVEEIIR